MPCTFMSGTSPVHGLYWFSTLPKRYCSLSLFFSLSFCRLWSTRYRSVLKTNRPWAWGNQSDTGGTLISSEPDSTPTERWATEKETQEKEREAQHHVSVFVRHMPTSDLRRGRAFKKNKDHCRIYEMLYSSSDTRCGLWIWYYWFKLVYWAQVSQLTVEFDECKVC